MRAFLAGLAVATVAQAAFAQALPTGDAVKGEALFKQRCAICHNADKGGADGVGPALYGVFGAKAASDATYAYSAKLKALGSVWTMETLDTWLQNPQAMVPGTKMALAPQKVPQERADLIAFLKSRSDAPAKPAPKAKSKKK